MLLGHNLDQLQTTGDDKDFLQAQKQAAMNHWHFSWDMNNTMCCNGFYIEFRQSFAKETFSYDEHLKS